jgi:hypothetical protein
MVRINDGGGRAKRKERRENGKEGKGVVYY